MPYLQQWGHSDKLVYTPFHGDITFEPKISYLGVVDLVIPLIHILAYLGIINKGSSFFRDVLC